MINKTLKLALQVTFVMYVLSCSYTLANAFDASASVLKFQTKMAERGVVESQYKLGFMYETGSGVEQNIDKALHWYKKAAAKRFKAASNRITYLKLKNTGMKHEYIHWLSSLKKSAQTNDKDALFLLGQLYADGLGVNKSLTRSLEFLHKAARQNMPSAEPYIFRVKHELAILQQKYASPVTVKGANQLSSSENNLAPDDKSQQINPVNITKKLNTAKTQIRQQSKPLTKKTPPVKAQIQKPVKASVRPITSKNQTSSKPIKPITRIAATTAPAEPDYNHPMDMMCGGNNRFMSGCR